MEDRFRLTDMAAMEAILAMSRPPSGAVIWARSLISCWRLYLATVSVKLASVSAVLATPVTSPGALML